MLRLSLTTKILITIALLVASMSAISIYAFYQTNREVATELQDQHKAYILSRIREEKDIRMREAIRSMKLYAAAIQSPLAESLFHLESPAVKKMLETFSRIEPVTAVYVDDMIMDKPYLGFILDEDGNPQWTSHAFRNPLNSQMMEYPLRTDKKLIGKLRIFYDMGRIETRLNAQQQQELQQLATESKKIEDRMRRYLWEQVAIVLILMLALLLLIALLLDRLVNRPLRTVQKNLRGFFAFFHDVKKRFTPQELKTSDEFGEMSREINRNITSVMDMHQELEGTQREILFTIGTIAEAHSQETGYHVQRVAEYSKLLARHYGLTPDEVELIGHASAMHDIGKLAIPDSILTKPGKLTSEEFRTVKEHAFHGYNMLRHSKRPLLQAAATIAHEHHEKYDGTGYPRGLKADQIHIYGRILALADVFDALASDRVYKKAWKDEDIFELIHAESGKHFDPKLVDIFFNHLNDFLSIRDKLTDK